MVFQKVPSEQIRRTGDAIQNMLLDRANSMMAQIQGVMLQRDSYALIAWGAQFHLLASFVRVYVKNDKEFGQRIQALTDEIDREFATRRNSEEGRRAIFRLYSQMYYELADKFKRFNLYPPLSVGYRMDVGETRGDEK